MGGGTQAIAVKSHQQPARNADSVLLYPAPFGPPQPTLNHADHDGAQRVGIPSIGIERSPLMAVNRCIVISSD